MVLHRPVELAPLIGMWLFVIWPGWHFAQGNNSLIAIAKLRGERPAYNPIGKRYPEMIVAVETLNRLIAHHCGSVMDSNMDLLLGFAAWAFHRHHNVVIVSHPWASDE
jgi:hypothetical protein